MFKTSKRNLKSILAIVLALVMFLPMSTITVFANNTHEALINLRSTIVGGEYTSNSEKVVYDFSENVYETEGGGYLLYLELMDTDAVASTDKPLFIDSNFQSLKPKAKQDFLKDVFTICNAMADDSAKGWGGQPDSVTSDTVDNFTKLVEQQSGMGSALIATLLQNTKPDYAAANRIYKPFSGIVGIILGLISVLIIALLGITMALDIAYLVIPAFYLLCGGENKGENKGSGLGGLISQEAKNAYAAANGSQSGGANGQGENRLAVALYFKARWLGLVVLGICLLYLVQGQIYSFVAWIIDLMSGFIGF